MGERNRDQAGMKMGVPVCRTLLGSMVYSVRWLRRAGQIGLAVALLTGVGWPTVTSDRALAANLSGDERFQSVEGPVVAEYRANQVRDGSNSEFSGCYLIIGERIDEREIMGGEDEWWGKSHGANFEFRRIAGGNLGLMVFAEWAANSEPVKLTAGLYGLTLIFGLSNEAASSITMELTASDLSHGDQAFQDNCVE